MNKKQKGILEEQRKEAVKKEQVVRTLEVLFVIGLFLGWIVHWFVSVICLIIVMILGLQENSYKKEIKEIEFKLAGD